MPFDRVEDAIRDIRDGRLVIVADDEDRENEGDLVGAAVKATPEMVNAMRRYAGGLICLAISNEVASKLGLAYMHEMIASFGKVNPLFLKLTEGTAGYGDKPSFSISINHRITYTGVTDSDRALTISRMAQVCRNIDDGGVDEFASNFRAPGHVPILIASKRLLQDRMGHTELCIYLAKLADLTPAIVMCEMMHSQSHRALTFEAAKQYAGRHGIPLVDAGELKARAKVA